MPKSTLPLASGTCPKCGKWGQHKMYKLSDSKSIYERYDHYGGISINPDELKPDKNPEGKELEPIVRISRLHHRYLYSCYIGKVKSDLELQLEKQNLALQDAITQIRKQNMDIIFDTQILSEIPRLLKPIRPSGANP